MVNKEYSVRTRVLSDGRIMPTTLGRHRTDEEKAAISRANAGRKPSQENIKLHLTVWPGIRPLVKRNGSPVEIAEITQTDLNKIQGAVSDKTRLTDPVSEYFSDDWQAERTKRVNKRRGPNNERRINQNAIIFARNLYKVGLIPEETPFWDLAKKSVESEGRSWFGEFAMGLLIEAYMIAYFKKLRGQDNLINTYIQIGEKIDSNWFNGQEMNYKKAVVAGILIKNKLI